MTFPCSIGRSGKRYLKREGDGASPRGAWQVRRLFYRADKGLPLRTGLQAQAMRDYDGWCETVGDRNYNRLVRIPYATSHETMKRPDHLYDIVVELSHNERPRVQGHGSAVFFHLRQPGGLCCRVDARHAHHSRPDRPEDENPDLARPEDRRAYPHMGGPAGDG